MDKKEYHRKTQTKSLGFMMARIVTLEADQVQVRGAIMIMTRVSDSFSRLSLPTENLAHLMLFGYKCHYCLYLLEISCLNKGQNHLTTNISHP